MMNKSSGPRKNQEDEEEEAIIKRSLDTIRFSSPSPYRSFSSRQTVIISSSTAWWLQRFLLLALLYLGSHIADAYDAYRPPRSYDVHQQQHYPQQQQSYDPPPPRPPVREYYPPPPTSSHHYEKYYKQFLPGPQYCPETGRTVCAKVAPYYPTDEVFAVIKIARAKHFNISSEFADEADNDAEPQLEEDFDNPFAGWLPGPEPYQMAQGSPFSQRHQHHQHLELPGGGIYPPQQTMSPYSPTGNAYHRPTGGYQQKPKQVLQYHNYEYNLSGANWRPPMSPTYGYKPYEKVTQQHQQLPYGTKTAPQGGSYPASPVAHRHRYKRQAPGGSGTGANANSLPNEPICPSRTIVIEPRAAMNDKSQWKFIVNLADRDPRLKQSIKVEVCRSQIALPFGFTSRCRQKYIKKKLISLDPSGQSISSENFFAPSCCVCEVVRIPVDTSATQPRPPSSSIMMDGNRRTDDSAIATAASTDSVAKTDGNHGHVEKTD